MVGDQVMAHWSAERRRQVWWFVLPAQHDVAVLEN